MDLSSLADLTCLFESLASWPRWGHAKGSKGPASRHCAHATAPHESPQKGAALPGREWSIKSEQSLLRAHA